MNGAKTEQTNRGVTDGSRFVFEEPVPVTPVPGNETGTPEVASRPSPDAFKPRPTRPFPISGRDENPKRGNWWNKIEFIFACILVCTSLSSTSNLPYIMYTNGGGIFFIVVSLLLVLLAFPYLILEMALGQFSSLGFISVWNFSPLLKGFGLVATLYLVLRNVLANVISAYNLIYAFYAVSSETLPWVDCSHEWNTQDCKDGTNSLVSPDFVDVGVDQSFTMSNVSYYSFGRPAGTTPAQEFFSYLVGNSDSDLSSVGGLRPNLVFALLATWGVVLLLTCLGAKLTGKVAYFMLPITVILPFALLIRGATLEGAHQGLIFFFYIDMGSVLTYRFWIEALSQAFFISFIGFGVFSSLASFNKFHNNFCLDAFLIIAAVIVISIMHVLMVATFVGYYAHNMGLALNDVVYPGFDFIFVNMPSILATLPAATAWTCVFFLTNFLTILSSSIYVVQSLLTTFLDVFHLPHSWIFLLPTSGIICVLSFLISLPMVTDGGFAVINAVEFLVTTLVGSYISIFLPLAAVWIYGTIPKWDILRLPREIQRMVGFFPKPLQMVFLLFWACIIPVVSAIFFVHWLVSLLRIVNVYNPLWMGYILLAVGIVPLILIPIFVGIFQLVRQRRSYNFFTNLFWKSAQSSPDWGPAVDIHRQQTGYSNPNNPHQLNYEIQYNPTTTSPANVSPQGVVAYPQPPFHSPPPAYNGYSQMRPSSPDSTMKVSPAQSPIGSPGLPSAYPSPLAGAQFPPASPATVSATDTVDSNRLYPTAPMDYTSAETDLGLSEHEDSPFVNLSSHETTL